MIYELALIGNPNSGKTSLFNELTGSNQHVGNWPGVTVEKKSGKMKQSKDVMIQDLPGIYSLSPYTPEEKVTRDYLLLQPPTGILNILDATNLERNLYLTLQLLEIGIPMLVVLNMMDIIEKNGEELNHEKLAYRLGVPVLSASVTKKTGMDAIISSSHRLIKNEKIPTPLVYDNRLEVALAEIGDIIIQKIPQQQLRWYSIKLFERDEIVKNEVSLNEHEQADLEEIILLTEKVFQDDSESIIVNERYRLIEEITSFCLVKKEQFAFNTSDKIDHIVTNRWLALPIFMLVMGLVYYLSMRTIGLMGSDWINEVLFGKWIPEIVGQALSNWQIAQWLQDLILDGIISGIGSVLGFVPQIMVLFFCLSLLEDCGYMSRIAFVLDRLFRKFGLSGKSFIPMLIATGCGVPGIMASRTIENENDRRMTVMVTTFMPCSAKLPIIALIAGALFSKGGWLVSLSAYFVGITAIVLSGIILKKTRLFGGNPAPFIMELPAYHLPKIKSIWAQTWNRSKSFIQKAASVIFVTSIIIWFLSSFNFKMEMVEANKSILASFGNAIAFLFIPLGWGQWQTAVATITGFVAKENIVGTFGVLFGGVREISEDGQEIWPLLQQALTPLAGYSFLLFNLLCAPCVAAIGAMKRELVTWRWTLLAIGYQMFLAYAVSFVVYQIGRVWIESQPMTVASYIAFLMVIGVVYLIFRKPKQYSDSCPLLKKE